MFLLEKEEVNKQKEELHLQKLIDDTVKREAQVKEINRVIEESTLSLAKLRLNFRKIKNLQKFKLERENEAKNIKQAFTPIE